MHHRWRQGVSVNSRRLWRPWVALFALGVMACVWLPRWPTLSSQPGIDFYQFWGVAKAQRESGYRLSSPYRNLDGYQQAFHSMAVASKDPLLIAAVHFREKPDLTGTPLLYYVFGSITGDNYRVALVKHAAWLLAAFLCGAFLLIRSQGEPIPYAAAFSALLVPAFVPFFADLKAGNLNALQFLYLILLAQCVQRYGKTPLARRRALFAAGVAVALVLLTLLKPNVVGATLLLGCCLFHLSASRVRVFAAVAASIGGLVLITLPCLFFGSASVWEDWLHGPVVDVEHVTYPVMYGNCSTVALLHELFDVPVAVSVALIALFLTAVAWISIRPFARQAAAHQSRAAVLDAVLANPFLCAGLGITGLFAVSPLVWVHYFVLLLMPALWICSNKTVPVGTRMLGWLALLLMADVPRWIYSLLAGTVPPLAVDLLHGCIWIPVWIGLLRCVDVAALPERARPSDQATVRPA